MAEANGYAIEIHTIFPVYQIKGDLDVGYNGAGKAWAVIKDGAVVGIRYMSRDIEDGVNVEGLPAWVKSVCHEVYPQTWTPERLRRGMGPKKIGLVRMVAKRDGYRMTGPRGGHITAGQIVREAHGAYWKACREDFTVYRAKCRAELAQLGVVVSGECSCYEFIPNVKWTRLDEAGF